MEWYGYLFLILFLLTTIIFILYIVFKPRDKSLSDIKIQLKETEELHRELKNKLIRESVERKKIEKQNAELKLQDLENKYSYDLATLSKKEKKEYETLKQNPQDGIMFIRSLIDDK